MDVMDSLRSNFGGKEGDPWNWKERWDSASRSSFRHLATTLPIGQIQRCNTPSFMPVMPTMQRDKHKLHLILWKISKS